MTPIQSELALVHLRVVYISTLDLILFWFKQ